MIVGLSHKKWNVKESTYARYVWLIDCHIRASLGNKKLNQITEPVITNYIYQKVNFGNQNKPAIVVHQNSERHYHNFKTNFKVCKL